jgi:hypothetical protein
MEMGVEKVNSFFNMEKKMGTTASELVFILIQAL